MATRKPDPDGPETQTSAAAPPAADLSPQTSAAAPPAADLSPLSAGEADDLLNAGVTISPFTGARLNALDYGITPGNPEALAAAEADLASREG